MGACNFGKIIIGKFECAKDAYDRACTEALQEYGHQDGYNGTISTTEGCRDLTNVAPRYGTKAFDKWEEKRLGEMQKWSYCGAIEIKGSILKTLKGQKNLTRKMGIKAFYFFGWAAE